jgi:hypothetical protein
MKTLVCTLAAIAFTRLSVDARIGETLDELVRRFGPFPKPMTTSFGQEERDFSLKDWHIHVNLLNGRSACETYTITGEARELSHTDIDLILGANSRGKQWKPLAVIQYYGVTAHKETETSEASPTFVNAWELDGEALICIEERNPHHSNRWLKIMSKEWNDYVTALLRKGRDKAVKDSGL